MKHCMLLWKKPSAKPLQTQIDCAFDVFSVIRDLREEYSPHFYKANKKKTSQPIAWSADAFMEALKKKLFHVTYPPIESTIAFTSSI